MLLKDRIQMMSNESNRIIIIGSWQEEEEMSESREQNQPT